MHSCTLFDQQLKIIIRRPLPHRPVRIQYSYPFLPQFHNPKLGVNDTAPADGVQPIVTDGTHLRSLYLDAFYIPDATLAFLNGIKLYLFVLSQPLTLGARS